jgi:hypothetical protein
MDAKFSNRFWIGVGPEIVRFAFSDQRTTGDETLPHSEIVMSRTDAAALRDKLFELLSISSGGP